MKKYILLIFFIFLICLANNSYAQRYYVVIASRPSKTIAENDVEKLKASGFVNAGVMYHTAAKRYRVYINSFDSKELASDEAAKYKNKFKDSWIFKGKSMEKIAEEPSIQSQAILKSINDLRSELSGTRTGIDSVNKEIAGIKDEIANLSSLLEEHDLSNSDDYMLLNEKIKSLNEHIAEIEKINSQKEQEIKSLNEHINGIQKNYVKTSDTISYSWKIARKKFDFGNSKLTFALGLTQSNLFSTLDSGIYSYFRLDTGKVIQAFYGLNLSAGVNFSRHWSTDLNLKSYIYLNNFYLFPSINVRYSQQLGSSHFKINPSFSVGTELLIFKNKEINRTNFFIYSPGIEAEWGLSKRISLVAKGSYHFITQFNNIQYVLSNIKCSDLSVSIRFSIL